jgi:PhnB protein
MSGELALRGDLALVGSTREGQNRGGSHLQIRPYLNFQGECQEAIDLYTRAFEAELIELMRFSDIPQSADSPMQLPDDQKSWIVQATMGFGGNLIRLSDCPGELNDARSERVAIVVECATEKVKRAFTALAEEGRVGIPLQRTFFSPCHGVVFDKFGVMWNLVAERDAE